jgi:hypothetical protein
MTPAKLVRQILLMASNFLEGSIPKYNFHQRQCAQVNIEANLNSYGRDHY